MIARAPYLFLLLILVPDLYFDAHYWKHRLSPSRRLLCWLPSIGLAAYTIYLMYEKNFIPDNPTIVYIYLFLLGLIAIPKFVFFLCSIFGLGICKLFRKRVNFGNLLGFLLTPCIWYILIYGSFVGFNKLEVNRHTYVSASLPEAFDGYKIVLFSDAHVGTYAGSKQWLLQRAVDSINALKPDMIVFTGDLQNTQPSDLYPHMDILSSLKAKDGVFSVLGNHDYAEYVGCDDARKVANCRETVSLERQMGWTLLRNEHRQIERGKSHIIIAGMENDGDGKRFPQKGNIQKTLGKRKDEFILMLEHDPSCWRRKIIPDGRAQLTLSGHTHAMQFKLGSWSPMSLTGKEWNGWYTEGQQSLFITAGLGGLIPFRFGATGEIVVITLRSH
ncbi:MAG: metallophosphoesterase [Prevotella sp.]|nr:metallophosphoesterase [Prevotella sp.]